MVKIGIVGVGCVGTAVLQSVQAKISGDDAVLGYDKYKNIGTFEEILDADILLLCLPTPYSNESHSYDKSPIHSVCKKLSKHNYQGLVVVKSTVEPTTCEMLSATYSLSICHNPEFLSANSAYKDFHHQNHIVIGSTKAVKKQHLDSLISFYNLYYPAKMTLCTSEESESMKLFCNNFYAVKIQFFNELYLLCKERGFSFTRIKDIMIDNGWINPKHTDVPGHDGELSYSGLCFPKDTNALLSFMKESGTKHGVLEAVVREHDEMRKDQHRFDGDESSNDERYNHSAA